MLKQILGAAAAACAIAGAVDAQSTVKWGEAGGWEIMVDPAAGNGCLMQKFFDDGLLVQFGALPLREGGFIAAYRREWVGIEDGEVGPVTFAFDGINFNGQANGYIVDGWYGGYAFTNNPVLAYDFAQQQTMTITGPAGNATEIDLTGTKVGVEEVLTCQAAQPA